MEVDAQAVAGCRAVGEETGLEDWLNVSLVIINVYWKTYSGLHLYPIPAQSPSG